MGLRPPLPLLSTPRSRTATLAPLLQPAQTTQLTRRPNPNQPHSQPLWAGHLVAEHVGLAGLSTFSPRVSRWISRGATQWQRDRLGTRPHVVANSGRYTVVSPPSLLSESVVTAPRNKFRSATDRTWRRSQLKVVVVGSRQ